MASSEGGYDSRSYSWGTGETRCYVEANITSTSDGSVYISFSGKVRSGNDSGAYHRISGYGVTCTVSTSAGGSCSASSSYNYANWVANCSGGVTCSRQRSAYNVTVTCSYSSYNGASNSGSTSVTLTVPAKPSHTISFNANGGSGAPGSITKWYGEQITIPTTKPTRENYQFDGWSTSSTATSPSYLVGQSYWVSDSNQTYYAVWTLLYKAPTVTADDVYRVDSASSTTESALGTYGRAQFDWSVDTTIYPDNVLSTITATALLSDGSTPTCTITGGTSGTSGIVYVIIPIPTNISGTVSLTVTDTAKGGSGSAILDIAIGHVPFELANGGTSVGLLNSAGDNQSITLGSLRITKANDPDLCYISMEDLISLLTPKVWRFSEKSYSSGSTYTPGDGTATASLLFTTTLLESTAHDAFFTKHSGSLDIVTPGIYHMVFSEGGYCSTRFYSNITINGNVICEGMAPSSGHYTNAISDVCWLLNAGDVVKCTETYEGSNRSKLLGGKYTFFNIEYLGHL